MTTLEKLLSADREEISNYLGYVDVEQFKLDIKELMSAYVDKNAIQNAIEKLQSLV